MTKSKDIVIIADFCGSFDHKGNNRFIYLANLLIAQGHSVEIVTSDFRHGDKKHFSPIVIEYNGITIKMLHEPAYSKNVGFQRFVSHYKWGKTVGAYLKKRKKPDVVYCAMPPLEAAKMAGRYCNQNGIKFIIDIQDLWPEAYKMVFNIPLISPLLFAPFNLIANSAYRCADEIVAVSQTYVNRALRVNQKVKKGHAVFLGTNLKTFDINVKNAKIPEKKANEIWLVYCGTLGASYDLKCVFDAMKILKNPILRLIVMGSGPKEREFKDYAKGLNVEFLGRLPYQEMCGILSECDIAVNPIMHNAAQSIINKHADYAASGKPVINTQENQEYRQLVDDYKMGFNVPNNDALSLAKCISTLCLDSDLRMKMGHNARKCAEERFNRESSYLELIEIIEGR